ncbi:MAG: SBBP repeat-containing protein, partial [Actinomycetota bacterium]|nr:SBBP repeat-containing protein [Actinomycetota bacterium]
MALFVTVCQTAILLAPGQAGARPPNPGPGAEPTPKEVVGALERLPLRFEPNHGQTSAGVQFLSRGPGYTLFLSPGEAVVSLVGSPHGAGRESPGSAPARSTVRMSLVGANPGSEVAGVGRLPGVSNYFVGDPTQWRRAVPGYAGVRYAGVYPGIDLVFRGDAGQLEYDFELEPGRDAGVIALEFEGAGQPSLDPNGDLVLHPPSGEIRQRRPVLYQQVAGARREVPGAFVLLGGSRVGFQVGAYDRSKPLVIDPVLDYSTYLGGTGIGAGDAATGIAVDADGSAYVTGSTASLDFPTTPGAPDLSCGAEGRCGSDETFSDGMSNEGSTVYTSASASFQSEDAGLTIAGTNIAPGTVIAAVVNSTTVELSAAASGTGSGLSFTILERSPPKNDAFVTKLDPTGSQLLYSTYLGGSQDENLRGGAIAVGPSGAAFVTGSTDSPDFPTTPGALQTDRRGCQTFDSALFCPTVAFLTRLSPDGSAIEYSTYIGGSGAAASRGVAVDGRDNAFVVGSTSGAPCFGAGCVQTTANGHQRTPPGHLSFSDGATVEGSTTFTSATANFTDDDRRIPIVGTNIAEGTTIAKVIDTTTVKLSAAATASGSGVAFALYRQAPSADAFVVGVDTSRSALVYGSYLGGRADDSGQGVAVDAAGKVYVTGTTRSKDFPTTEGAFDPTCGTDGKCNAGTDEFHDTPITFADAFVAKLDPAALDGPTSLAYSTYLGGEHNEVGDVFTASGGIAVDAAGNARVTGATISDDFPTTPGAYDRTCGSDGSCNAIGSGFSRELSADAFVTQLSADGSDLVSSTYVGGSGDDRGLGIALHPSGAASITGSTFSEDLPVASPLQFPSGGLDAFVTTLTADGAVLESSTYLGGAGDDAGNAIAAPIGGTSSNTTFVAGRTSSADFPTRSAHQPSVDFGPGSGRGGGNPGVGFVARLGPGRPPAVARVAPSGGPFEGGTPVVISGTGFTGASEVRFGDVPTSFTVDSDGQITALSPARAEGGISASTTSVTVTTAEGTSVVAGTASTFVFGEGAIRTTGSCVEVCPSGGSVLLPNGKVLVINTARFEAPFTDPSSQVYDPAAGTWAPTAACDQREVVLEGPNRCGETGFTLTVLPNGKVLLAGGLPKLDTFTATSSAFLYDPDAVDQATKRRGAWTTTGPMTVGRSYHTATLLPNGTVLVAGGCNQVCGQTNSFDDPMASAEVYDPARGTWARTGNMNVARVSATATLLGPTACGANCGKVLVAGGSDPLNFGLDAAEIYDPDAIDVTGVRGSWTPTSALAAPRVFHTATLLPDGKVLVAGGQTSYVSGGPGGGSPLNSAELYDPLEGKWRLTGILNRPRLGHTATLLPNAKVLVAGGDAAEPATAELYDPGRGRWISASAGSYRGESFYPFSLLSTATLLPSGPASVCGANCGKVLLAGGTTRTFEPHALAELYTPRPAVDGLEPSSGAAGTTVAITGTGLASVASVSFGGVPAAFTPDAASPDTRLIAIAPPQGLGPVEVTVAGEGGRSRTAPGSRFTYTRAPTEAPINSTGAGARGYRLVASDGGIFSFGDAAFLGSTGALALNKPIVGMASTPSGRGYRLVASDGGIFSFGDAAFLGSTGSLALNKPIVGMASTPSGKGYWLVASDGGVFAFGDAVFRGSTGAIRLNKPMVGMAPTPSGNGYWMVASDGGVFAFGDAAFFGSTGSLTLNQPIVGMASTPSGKGYWLVASDGGVFAFGDAAFRGSTGAIRLNKPIVGMAPTPSGNGYWMVASDGGVFAFGDA